MIALVVLLIVLVLVGAAVGWRLLRVVGGPAADGAGTVELHRAADRVRPPGNLGTMPDASRTASDPTVPDADPTDGGR